MSKSAPLVHPTAQLSSFYTWIRKGEGVIARDASETIKKDEGVGRRLSLRSGADRFR